MTAKATAPENDDVTAMSFEAALAALEEIVATLEGGEASLERSIALYERGARLREHCERKLGDAELRVEKIVKGQGGDVGVEPLDPSGPARDGGIPF